MEKTEIFDIDTRCESPIYVETSPVSSPVFVSKHAAGQHANAESDITQKLILPPLDNSMLPSNASNNHPQVAGVIDSKDVTVDSVASGAPSRASPTPSVSSVKGDKEMVETKTAGGSAMVIEVVKDFNYCKEEFMKQVKESNVSVKPEMIMRLIRIAMMVVEQTKETGPNKKQFVIDLLKEIFLNNGDIPSEYKLEILTLLTNGVVSDSIDMVIDASKGKFDINKAEKVVEEVAKSCFTLCIEKLLKKK
jgi:hypothetical protein